MRLRPATEADREWAQRLLMAAFLDLVTPTWGGWTDEQVAKIERAWRTDRTRVIEPALGWVRLEHHPDHDWLDLIVVDPEQQGRGLGTAVMRHLLAEAHDRGVELRLSVYRTNPARRLYRRLGFTEHPRDDLRVLMIASPRAAPT